MVFVRSDRGVFQAALGMCAVVLARAGRAGRRRRRRRAAAAALHRWPARSSTPALCCGACRSWPPRCARCCDARRAGPRAARRRAPPRARRSCLLRQPDALPRRGGPRHALNGGRERVDEARYGGSRSASHREESCVAAQNPGQVAARACSRRLRPARRRPAAASAATRYLSPSGSDAGDCISAPCATFGRAYAARAAGDVVERRPRRLSGPPGDARRRHKRVTFRGAARATRSASCTTTPSNVTFDGIDVDAGGGTTDRRGVREPRRRNVTVQERPDRQRDRREGRAARRLEQHRTR